MDLQPTIFVVDDDPAVARDLASVGQLLGLPVCAFASAHAFLQAHDPARPGCLVLELQLSDLTGLELQQKLADEGSGLPIIMISGRADVRIAVEVMSRGALTLLEKPLLLEELVGHIRRALEVDAARREARARRAAVEARSARLTPKEHEVFGLIAAGMTNKQIAAELHLSVRAVEDRRARLMKKLGVRSLAELLRWRAEQGAVGP